MPSLFQTIIYKPLYNGFVLLLSVLPGADVGLAIVVLTIAVRTLLLPLTHRAVSSQAKMRKIEPELKEIREKHAKDRQEQARKTMELYKKHGINPFSSCLSLLIQLPVIIGLFWVFYKGLPGHQIDASLLYASVHAPAQLGLSFLGLVDITKNSIVLALLAGLSQHLQMRLSMPPVPAREASKEMSFKDEIGRNMSLQMRYILPAIIVVVAWGMPAAVALYWTTTNLFSVGHELFVRRKAKEIVVD